jgi:LacI family transcriptional regulator
MNVPGDISVIGFDNLPLCTLTVPKLSTVSQDIEMKAKKSGDLLFSMMKEKSELTALEKIPVMLVERESVKKI